jgi:hypothetical protein
MEASSSIASILLQLSFSVIDSRAIQGTHGRVVEVSIRTTSIVRHQRSAHPSDHSSNRNNWLPLLARAKPMTSTPRPVCSGRTIISQPTYLRQEFGHMGIMLTLLVFYTRQTTRTAYWSMVRTWRCRSNERLMIKYLLPHPANVLKIVY